MCAHNNSTQQQAKRHCKHGSDRGEGPADDAVIGRPSCTPVPGAPGDGGVAGVIDGDGVWHVEGAAACVRQRLQMTGTSKKYKTHNKLGRAASPMGSLRAEISPNTLAICHQLRNAKSTQCRGVAHHEA